MTGVAQSSGPAEPVASSPFVTILMGVYNGESDLPEQLRSIAAQSHSNWQLLASDDASTDESRALIEAFAGAHDALCLDGPCTGASSNFLSLIRRARDHAPPGHWLAFSDQDDIWLPDRLERGLTALAPFGRTPVLYCSRTWITDAACRTRRLSAPRPRPPSFRNALVQNIAAGNTILLNPAAAELVEAAAHEVDKVVVHDWWIYQLVTAAGGQVVHDDAPTLLYRQHDDNQIGANDQLRARLRRIRQLLRGDFRDWNTVNIAALRASAPRLAPEHRALLEAFAALRDAPLPVRLARLSRLGLYRQSLASQAALWLAALLGRL